MRAAIYARYSSEACSPTSIADQITSCRSLAARRGIEVLEDHVYHDDAVSLRESALENRENVVRLLNSYIASLIGLRDEIDSNDREALGERLENAWAGRIRWFGERTEADWLNKETQRIDAPSFGDRINQMLFGSMADRIKPK